MAKRGNAINGLINEAIDASIDFEAKMDSIDFNSYLPEDKNQPNDKKPENYDTYESMTKEAQEYCEDAINQLQLSKKIKQTKPPTLFSNENDLIKYLIYQLFEAKKIRLKARKQTKWKEEKNKYIEATDKLHKAFASMPSKDFYGEVGKNIYTKSNWAKVLYYNEMAICHSGLIESSMSLGYAEKTIELLKELDPDLKNIENKNSNECKKLKEKIGGKENPITFSQLIKLYTFALYNKGEAERLLHNNDLSLRTFKKIIEIYENKNLIEEKSSDYYYALLRMALILIDQGRGKEALELLEKVKNLEKDDYRKEECDIERASAFIDQKKFEDAIEKLDGYKKGLTFTSRKASLYIVRCLFEWRKNKPIEFTKGELKEEYDNIPKEIKDKRGSEREGIIEECIDRKDEDNFKRACRYYSEFHKLEREKIEEKQSKESNEKAEERKKKELWGYFLYLFHEKMHDVNKDLKDMLDKDWKGVKRELYEDEDDVDSVLDRIEDTEYMKDFFDVYRVYLKYNQDDQGSKVIEKLYKRLGNLYREKDDLSKLGELHEKYRLYNETSGEAKEKDKNENKDNGEKDSVKFIRECFFKGKPFDNDKKSIFLCADSMWARMEQNTLNFSEKIVGKTKRFPKDKKFKAILTILRRWNSFTPTLASSVNPSKGGGYFLYFQKNNKSLGIVIDPGYDFLDNLFSQGYRIGDIDVIIVSHAHPDHTDNLPSILSLFHELNGRLGKYYYENKFINKEQFNKKHLKLIISQGVFDQYYKLIKPSEESLKDIFVVQPGIERANEPYCFPIFDDNHSIEIEAFKTSHRDLSQWESLGFIIKINNNGISRQIGYTSDAHWEKEFSENFKDCHIICAHLGSIVDILGKKKGFCSLCQKYEDDEHGECKKLPKCKEERFKNGRPSLDKLKKQAREKSHLYLSGITMFFDDILSNRKNGNNEMELAIISEFGEELKGGIRMDLFHKFDNWFRCKGKAKCFPGDIGLEINLLNSNILCCCCQEFKSKDEILPIAYGKEEGLFFVCEECNSVLSTYQIEEKLKNNYENVRKLELADESK